MVKVVVNETPATVPSDLAGVLPWHGLLAVWGAISNRGTGRADGSAQPLVLSRGLRLERCLGRFDGQIYSTPKPQDFYLIDSMFCSTHSKMGLIVWEKTWVTNDDIDLVWHTCMTSQIGSWALSLDERSMSSVFEVNEILVLLELWRKSVESLLEFPWALISYGVMTSWLKKLGIDWSTIVWYVLCR